jgi:hypothetical protein
MSRLGVLLQQADSGLCSSVRVNYAEARYRPWLAATNAHFFISHKTACYSCFTSGCNTITMLALSQIQSALAFFYSKKTVLAQHMPHHCYTNY